MESTIYLLVLCAFAAIATAQPVDENTAREKKAISLFNIVQFRQDSCTPTSDSSLKGTCMAASECEDKSGVGGAANGNCAAGFGVCCVFTLKCGENNNYVDQNCTYFQNSNYPNSDTTATDCTFTFNRICDNLCSIRLDFENLVTANAPTAGDAAAVTEGVCSDDTIVATSPTGSAIPTLCGTLTGQHMYISTGSTGTAGTLAFTFSSTVSATRTYKIKATYYTCDHPLNPTDGCLQYFTGTSGTVSSYNFEGGVLLEGMNYNTCIRQEQGYCTIDYNENPTSSPDPFNLYLDATTAGTMSEITCSTAYINFDTTNYTPGRRCGDVLASQDAQLEPGTVTDTDAPFNFQTVTKFDMTATTSVIGYKIDYTQVPC